MAGIIIFFLGDMGVRAWAPLNRIPLVGTANAISVEVSRKLVKRAMSTAYCCYYIIRCMIVIETTKYIEPALMSC